MGFCWFKLGFNRFMMRSLTPEGIPGIAEKIRKKTRLMNGLVLKFAMVN